MTTAAEVTGLQDLQKRFREAAATRETLAAADRVCWCCCDEAETVSVRYDDKDLCFFCARDLLLHVILPQTEACFKTVEAVCREALDRVFTASKQQQQASGPASPVGQGGGRQDTFSAEWLCPHCTFQNSLFNDVCEVCEVAKPDTICPLCMQDFIQTKLCKFDLKLHKTWPCGACHAENLDDTVECRACHKGRTWFCSNCSLENDMATTQCSACEGVGKLASLKSFVNREMLKSTGLSIAEAERERDAANAAVEHQERLERRIAAMGLRSYQVADDGNCLFRAIAHQLVRDVGWHVVVRNMVVDYMAEHADDYAVYVGSEEYLTYLQNMRQNKFWGDELTVQAAARTFVATIHVATSEADRWYLKYKISSEDPAPGRHLFLSYISPVHYNCLVPPKDVAAPIVDLRAVLSGGFLLPDVDVSDPTAGGPVVRPPQPATVAARTVSPPQPPLPDAVPPPPQQQQPAADARRPPQPPPQQPRKSPVPQPQQRPSRPGTATRGSRENDFIPHAHLCKEREPAVVMVEALERSQSIGFLAVDERTRAVTLSPRGTIFYLHSTPRRFMLQDATVGVFLQPSRHPQLVAVGSHKIRVEALVARDLAEKACALVVAPETETTRAAQLMFAHSSLDCRYVSVLGGHVVCTQTAAGSYFLIRQLYGGAPERLCVYCRQWFHEGAPPDRSPSRCDHASVIDLLSHPLAGR